ncbi:MAG TPA: hypothetical protein VEJ63_03765 [Planctomycetota bacterium]|nr:hypothetical protein [Planctomycetota bacterium]
MAKDKAAAKEKAALGLLVTLTSFFFGTGEAAMMEHEKGVSPRVHLYWIIALIVFAAAGYGLLALFGMA